MTVETPVTEKKQFWPQVLDFFVFSILQARVWKKIYPGIMHFLLFWGVSIQIIGTAINLMQMKLFTPFELTIPREGAYFFYEWIMDLAGIFILVGVFMAVIRRLVMKPKYLGYKWDDYFAVILLTLMALAGFTTEAMRLTSAAPTWSGYSFMGVIVAGWYQSWGLTPEIAFRLQPFFLLVHTFLGLTFGAALPFTKMRHMLMAPLNILLRPRRAMGALEKIEDIENIEVLGVGNINEFSSRELLSFDACLDCGRCEDVCPATASGMNYSPRTLLQGLRQNAFSSLIKKNGGGSPELPAEMFAEGTLWACTTCGACLTRCPIFIRPPERVVDLRRYQTLSTGEMPKSVGDTLRNMERQGNPWGMPPQDRMKWAEGLNVRELSPGDETDILFFAGCAAAFDERNKKVTQSFVKLLQKANVDFGVLGMDEACCGETARRMGHEYIFQVMAEQNIEIFNEIKFKRIVSQCPHCLNTLKNEYPQMGGNFEVIHSSQLLTEIADDLSLDQAEGNGVQGRLTYHDSCYLGRYNGEYEAPRDLLDKAKTDRVEMARCGENSFCCGAGGGGMWVETDTDKRINQRRLQDALDVEADVVATACPYCLTMFEDALNSKGMSENIQVLDIAEVLEKQLDGAKK
ncbi:MAG: 4Fe-4S dicluster domain-containing protein [Anaerolineales bacterium]|uniref:4Fe-4S dicluster domain-containing protein n=1 Tax=Candidatus Desulfolinea nitratireducens TaxID=2841698 RepID=A0A8J6TIJ2_9CHLR|nr:4Fe-4S dicluster domain-containing protein [Candidatus Desulfolinea nitratireducens]MBL6960846.1 4Fe-4S dicluster domain-containing protein [Anaerolineales bacterium]